VRTTLSIDDDVLVAVKERARRERRSAGEVLSELARDALTREGAPARVEHLILVGTPNAGSPWARVRGLSELRDHLLRMADGDWRSLRDLSNYQRDGTGEAGLDLLPGSAFLNDLNARPLPADIRVTCIVGTLAPVLDEDARWFIESPVVRRVLGDEEARRVVGSIREWSGELGDGVVAASSARLDGIADVVEVEASHRGLVKRIAVEQSLRRAADHQTGPPPGIAVILDRLSWD